ncbi:predicted protein [Aspergillus terreus NIH2624]|uniref:NYN domain-containing protein n=1 Tax=Aspergillus terreus (strain NIH 2624 / FGSC A1156) TaxID=341663 RepID=Q0CSR1_ASPTN|nr:uncharacterized protein ATEG_03273 [Aspergillus terreus NIH2624]EAU36547.1 predicted protein [Aspergillus terreus NIH2624]
MPSSTSTSSDWDFTAVINLLHSPTLGKDQSLHGRRRDSNQGSSASVEPVRDVTTTSTPPKSSSKCEQKIDHAGSPKLGDFGSLWGVLDNNSLPERQSRHTQETAVDQPSARSKPIKILKRPVQESRTDSSQRPSPPAASFTITQDTTVRSTKVAPHPTDSTIHESATSDSSTEAESDSNDSTFDPSFSRNSGVFTFVPPQVGIATSRNDTETPPTSYDELAESSFPPPVTATPLPDRGSLYSSPTIYKSSTDRRVGLLTKLLHQFPDYADLVAQVGRPVGSQNGGSKKKSAASRPIHVFVDISNIMVGLHNCYKSARNIPAETRTRRLPLSFQNFSLILERGRPAAKRVLVGSDRFAAIKEGEQLGYETNILDRVQKVKTPSRRAVRAQRATRVRTTQDTGSSSETNDAPAERWVEQGVDEILHLKILESLLDTAEPATIVLASGDAAEAEFSGGFMRMVERALQRRWTVELVSFSQGTSYAYRRKAFREKWGAQFRLILLDDYMEELLDL